MVFRVDNANPNGDPLEGNRPRTNDNGYGEVTGECIRRKIRNRFIHMGLPVFVQSDSLCVDGYGSLAQRLAARKDIYDALRDGKTQKEGLRMACGTWLDVRLFGQIFAFSGVRAAASASVHGAVTICHGTSVEPVVIKDIHITKSTNGEDKGSAKGKSSDTMGSKSIVEQGLYVVKGSVNPFYADKNGVSDEDVEILKKALATIFENDESCARPAGSMAVCRLYWFEQPEHHACVPIHKIFELLDIQSQGSGHAHMEALQLLEYQMQRGDSLVRGVKEGPDYGPLAQYTNFEEFYQGFRKQLLHKLVQVTENRIKYYGASYKIAPDPMISAMIDGCVENGRDITAGGAKYTIFSPLITGLSDCVDSLAAIKKLVYEEQKISIEELAEALRNDFAGNEPLRQMLLNRAPKFGNDDEYVDSIARRMIRDVEEKTEELSKKYPDVIMPIGIGTFENYSKFGHKVGASASGRHAQEAIGSNYSPAFGADKEGPTAAIKSVVAADLKRFSTGCPLDMQVNSNETSGNNGLQRLCGLIKAFLDLGGIMLTITGVNEEVLLDAQVNPDQYRSLRVRMGGLSAYFIALPKEMQDVLIKKTKHNI